MQEYCSNLTVNGKTFSFYDLEKAAKSHDVKVGELPYTIRIILESLLRKKDGEDVKESHISDLMKFPNFPIISEVPFKPSRVILQDFTGVPVVVDLASMRDAIVANGGKAEFINPEIPVDLVIDHSVQVDSYGCDTALEDNIISFLLANINISELPLLNQPIRKSIISFLKMVMMTVGVKC